MAILKTTRQHFEDSQAPQLRAWSKSKRIPPVLLLCGPRGVGKREFALMIAQWLACTNGPWVGAEEDNATPDFLGGNSLGGGNSDQTASITLSGCGECSACLRVETGQAIDFQEITIEDSGSSNLGVDVFRKLKASQGFGAFSTRHRVVLIRDAERLTPQASNSLLKILEEPPQGWVFLLTTPDPTLLLPTIVSRCQVLRLKPLPLPQLLALLTEAGVEPTRARLCAEAAQGSWGRALELAQDDRWAKRLAVLKFIESPSREAQALIDWAATDEETLESLLTYLEHSLGLITQSLSQEGVNLGPELTHFRDRLVRKVGGKAQALTFSLARIESLFEARGLLRVPLNRKTVVQSLLFPFLKAE